jgi:hypothetical protein
MKRADQSPFAARISGRELPRVEAGVCHVAAAATRNADLGEELRAFLAHGYPRCRVGLRARDRPKKSGRASPGDNN